MPTVTAAQEPMRKQLLDAAVERDEVAVLALEVAELADPDTALESMAGAPSTDN